MNAVMPKTITKIEANPILSRKNSELEMLDVAAYCRVSTDSDEQLESYDAQVSYYTDYIAKNPKWRFAGIFADPGLTGTSDHRENFQRLIRQCKKGKIKLILVKSVARFARNVVDSLKYCRMLKAIGVGVYFEEQNLNTMNSDTEMILGIHSVMAQAESENISANVRWGIQQRMKSGTFAFRYNILGYRKGEDGEPEIVPEAAEAIREIYEMYLAGSSLDQLKSHLEAKGIRTLKGKNEWSKEQIKNILTNERYVGDMLLQKTFTENCISKKVRVNRGEMAKYLISNNHPAIVSREVFQAVQSEMARRTSKHKISDLNITEQAKYSGKYALSEKLYCGDCGSAYRRRVWVRKDGNKVVWRCISRLEHGSQYCHSSITVEESKLHQAICNALNQVASVKDKAFDLLSANLMYAVTGDNKVLDAYSIEQSIERVKAEMDNAVEKCAKTEGDVSRFLEGISQLNQQLIALREQLEIAKNQSAASEAVCTDVERIKKMLSDDSLRFDEYDDKYVRVLIDCIKVNTDSTLTVIIKGGVPITVDIPT